MVPKTLSWQMLLQHCSEQNNRYCARPIKALGRRQLLWLHLAHAIGVDGQVTKDLLGTVATVGMVEMVAAKDMVVKVAATAMLVVQKQTVASIVVSLGITSGSARSVSRISAIAGAVVWPQ
jgi:hypothetical protein